MDVKPIFLALVDISGHTKFIKVHKVSPIHAEHIIDELLESVIRDGRSFKRRIWPAATRHRNLEAAQQ